MESTPEYYPTPQKGVNRTPGRPDFTAKPVIPQIPTSEYQKPSLDIKVPDGYKGSTPEDSPWFDGLDKPQEFVLKPASPTTTQPAEQQKKSQSIYERLEAHKTTELIPDQITQPPKQSIFDRIRRLSQDKNKSIK